MLHTYTVYFFAILVIVTGHVHEPQIFKLKFIKNCECRKPMINLNIKSS